MRKQFSLKQLLLSHIPTTILVILLTVSLVTATATITIYLQDLPSGYSYTVKTDSINYWAVRFDGYKTWESTNFTLVMSNLVIQLLADGGGEVFIKEGSYYGQIYIPHQTSNKYIGFIGEGRFSTRILGNSDANGEGIIHSGQTSHISGGVFIKVSNLRISANSAGENYGIYLPFVKVYVSHVRIDGTFTGSSEIGMYYGGSGADATPSVIDDVEFRGVTATRAFDFWDENAVISALQISLVTGNLVSGIRLQGTAFSIERIGCYIGDGRSMTNDLLELDAVEQVNIGAMYLTDSATPSAYPTVFDVDSNSLLTIQHFFTSSGYLAKIFDGAITQANTMILGSFNSKPLTQVYTSVSNGTTKAHNLGITPSSVIAIGTISGEIISILVIDSTNITFGIIKHDGTSGTSQTVYIHIKP